MPTIKKVYLNQGTDADILQRVEGMNFSEYVRRLIREDISGKAPDPLTEQIRLIIREEIQHLGRVDGPTEKTGLTDDERLLLNMTYG